LVDKADLPGGTYDTQLTFAQELTEATKQVAGGFFSDGHPNI